MCSVHEVCTRALRRYGQSPFSPSHTKWNRSRDPGSCSNRKISTAVASSCRRSCEHGCLETILIEFQHRVCQHLLMSSATSDRFAAHWASWCDLPVIHARAPAAFARLLGALQVPSDRVLPCAAAAVLAQMPASARNSGLGSRLRRRSHCAPFPRRRRRLPCPGPSRDGSDLLPAPATRVPTRRTDDRRSGPLPPVP